MARVAIIVMPQNPDFEDVGWKVNLEVGLGMNIKIRECGDLSGDSFVDCVEKFTYSKKDVFAVSNYSLEVTSFYLNYMAGLVHSIELHSDMITDTANLTYNEWELPLNNYLSYTLYFLDPKLQIISVSPETFPRSKLEVKKQQTGAVRIFLKVRVRDTFVTIVFFQEPVIIGNKT